MNTSNKPDDTHDDPLAEADSSSTNHLPQSYSSSCSNSIPILTIYNQFPLFLMEDWNSGIGGGLWSTGLAMAHYFTTSHFQTQLLRLRSLRNDGESSSSSSSLRVLELGSGNGFLSVCLVVAAMMRPTSNSCITTKSKEPDPIIPIHVVATDTASHLSLMERTIQSNLTRLSSTSSLDLARFVTVQEYLWGDTFIGNNSSSNNFHSSGNTNTFDLIIGSDLAYRDDLHDPLIAALQHFHNINETTPATTSSSPSTTSTAATRITTTLLGVTMTDTKPIFFQKLQQAGFGYEKLADHLLQPEFRGGGSRQFGIFVIYNNSNHKRMSLQSSSS
ncbi:lysine methyltransferase [Nitzschia inconspicua]|uniref:Lysine methyltransferase n=1 Tax=Nitzschia inconspicua TaxID=303405 RepID=A0A9K3KP17_9STRA|nr:lysine methyltransferase [Nitzschia inconspicua]KAG7367879.1 lysine methyltransferase [Nitzschia inconspicua]